MPHSDALNHYEHRPGATTDVTKLHEKNYLPKVNGSVEDKRPENTCKKNVLLVPQNNNAAQQDKSRESCPVHYGKVPSESNKKSETESPVKSTENRRPTLKEYNAAGSSNTNNITCSCVCCMSDKEQTENILKELQNQILLLNTELSNYKTENQLLRKDINRAKNFVKRDIGRNVESFEDIVKKMTEDSWIGQEEKIVSLKKELRELKEEVKEKGLKPPPSVKRHETVSSSQVADDRKVHWRLKLERQSILRQTEREKHDLIEDRGRIKEKLEIILKRNKDLEEEIKSTRQELEETRRETNGDLISRLNKVETDKSYLSEKSRLKRSLEEVETKEKHQEPTETRKGPNGDFISRLHKVEKKAKFCLDEKSRLRRSLEEEETKEKQLLKRIEELEIEIKSQKKTCELTKVILSRKKSDDDELRSFLTTFESEATFEMTEIEINLNEVDEEHQKNVERLHILTDLLFAFEELFSQQKQSPVFRHQDDLSSKTSISEDSLNKESPERVQNGRTRSNKERIPTTSVKERKQARRDCILKDSETVLKDTKDILNKESPGKVRNKGTDTTSERNPTTPVKEIMHVRRKTVLKNAEAVLLDTKEKLDKTITDDEDQQYATDEPANFKDNCRRFVKIFKEKEKENLTKSERIYDLFDGVKEKTEEMLKNSSQLWRIASQIKIMVYKNKKLQKLVKNYANALISEKHGFCHTTWNDLLSKGEFVYNILGKENKFLKMLITNVVESKAYDFDLYTFSCKRKDIFLNNSP